MIRILILLIAFGSSAPAQADLLSPWHYIKNYQLGFDVGERRDSAEIGFDINRNTYNDADCEVLDNNLVHCAHEFENDSSGYGVFIEQPFKRRGLWHFDYDISFDLRILDSKLVYSGDKDPSRVPVKDMRLHLYSLIAMPYVTVGITPKDYPELLFSLGPNGEMVWGSVNINDTRYQIAERGVFRRSSVRSLLSFMQLNLVLKRFGNGYFALTMSQIRGDDHVQDGEILPEKIDQMTNLRLRLNKEFYGVKVLLK